MQNKGDQTNSLALSDPGFFLTAGGHPRSRLFGAHYGVTKDRTDQARRVFLGGIGAPDCWRSTGQYSILELGFGTGLNFLTTAEAWLSSSGSGRLDYFAVEAWPLSAEQISSALPAHFAHRALTRELLDVLPLRHPGFHRLKFAGGRVGLTLIYQQAGEAINNIIGRFDAFYLDGFAPERNPEMWTPALFQGLAAIGKASARLAASWGDDNVRARLSQAGFKPSIKQRDHSGWECLSAELVSPAARPLISENIAATAGGVAIIGAGVAGCFIARGLEERGLKPRLIDRHTRPFTEASGNPVALINPKLTLGSDAYARFNMAAFLDCIRAYAALAVDTPDLWIEPRGVYVSPDTDGPSDRFERLVAHLGWPEDMLRIEAAKQTGLGDRFFIADGGSLQPATIARAIVGPDQIIRANVTRIERGDSTWRIWDEDDRLVSEADTLVLANGLGARALLDDGCPPLEGRHGVIALLKAAEADIPQPSQAFGLYLSAAFDTDDGMRVQALGASFDHIADQQASNIDAEARATALWQQFRAEQPEIAAAFGEAPVGFRAGIRAVTPDQMPVVGPVVTPAGAPPLDRRRGQVPHPLAYAQDDSVRGLYLLTGLGARGFQSAPLLAAVLAAQISGAPLPLPADIMSHLVPARFLARTARGKGKIRDR